MKIKKCIIILAIFCLIIIVTPIQTWAEDKTTSATKMDTIITDMSTVGTTSVNTDKGIARVLTIVIVLIRIAGTGISLIVVTILGIKYMLASSNEKADIKKQAIPIVIGCALLFAAVNIVSIIADVGAGLNS